MLTKKQRYSDLKEIPAGTFIRTEKGYFYVYSNTRRYPFPTLRCMQSWSPQRVLKLSEDTPAVKKLKTIGKMKFRDGSLLANLADGKLYLVSEKKVRHITNPDVLVNLGIDRYRAVWVSDAEIKLHEEGEPLN